MIETDDGDVLERRPGIMHEDSTAAQMDGMAAGTDDGCADAFLRLQECHLRLSLEAAAESLPH